MMDRRAVRTRKALLGALIGLIQRKDYEAITIQDILDEADVGRSTFYAHYTGKDDLLRGGFKTLRAQLAQARGPAAASGEHAPQDVLGFSRLLFEHAGKHQPVYLALLGGRGCVVAMGEIRQILAEQVRQALASAQEDGAVAREVYVQFIVATFLTALTWWLEKQPALTAPQVDALFRHLAINGISGWTGAGRQ
jgi:AcrR family transcriptional regulator